MKALTIKKLQEAFLGKACTVLTVSVSKRDFMDQQFSDFFTVIIESIDEDGIFAKHLMTGCRAFFSWPHIVSVLAEQTINQSDPQYETIMAEIKKAPPEQQLAIVPVNPNASPYVDPDLLRGLAKQAQEVQGKMLRKNQ